MYSDFFIIFGYFMYNYAFSCNEFLNFHKNGRILLKVGKFYKFCGAFGAENGPVWDKSGHFLVGGSLQFEPWSTLLKGGKLRKDNFHMIFSKFHSQVTSRPY